MENQLVAPDDQLPMTVKEKNYFIVLILSLLIGAIDLKVLSYLDAVRSIVGIILLLPLCVLIKYSLQNSLMANEARTKRAKIDILLQRIFFEGDRPIKTRPEMHPEWEQLLYLIGSYNQLVQEKEKINGILVAFVKNVQVPTNFFCSIIEHDPGCSKAIATTLSDGDRDCYTYLT
jgi:hypothetical protein